MHEYASTARKACMWGSPWQAGVFELLRYEPPDGGFKSKGVPMERDRLRLAVHALDSYSYSYRCDGEDRQDRESMID